MGPGSSSVDVGAAHFLGNVPGVDNGGDETSGGAEGDGDASAIPARRAACWAADGWLRPDGTQGTARHGGGRGHGRSARIRARQGTVIQRGFYEDFAYRKSMTAAGPGATADSETLHCSNSQRCITSFVLQARARLSIFRHAGFPQPVDVVFPDSFGHVPGNRILNDQIGLGI